MTWDLRCTTALAKYVPIETPVLDFGCGTGLSGQALRSVGFKNIFGTEISGSLRDIAEKRLFTNNF